MEQFKPNNPGQSDIFSLIVGEDSKSQLVQIGKWGKYIAWCGIISAGAMGIIISLASAKSTLVNMPSASSKILYLFGYSIGASLIPVALFIYPTRQMIKYASAMRMAAQTSNERLMKTAFVHLKNSLRYMAVAFIVGLVFTAIILVAMFADAVG